MLRLLAATTAAFTAVFTAATAFAQSPGWQQTWDDTVAAAKKEGKVVVVGSPDPVMRNDVIPKFTERFGIKIEYIAGSSGQIAGRVRTERQSGIYSVDVYLSGAGTALTVLYPEKMLDPLKPMLILPEVADDKNWKGGKLRFADTENQHVMVLFASVDSVMFINEDHVKREEVAHINGLLDPKWRGRIASQDPNNSGTGANTAVQFYTQLGADFVRKLYIDQKPAFSRDRRQLTDWLARGTHPICITCRADDMRQLQKDGFKIREIFEVQGINNRLTTTPFVMAVANKAPNPNATRVLVNWLATKEVLEIYSRGYGNASLRADTDESFLDPQTIPKPGVTYTDDTNAEWLAKGRAETAAKMRAVLKAQ